MTVVNLFCEHSIEHQILYLLSQKQALANGVLDGQGDLAALKMPSGRAAMIERMQALMQAENRFAPRIVSAEETIAEELRHRHGDQALLIEARMGGDGRIRILAVLDLAGEALAAEAQRHQARRDAGLAVEVVDRPTWLAMQRLVAGGMIMMAEGQSHILHQSPDFAASVNPNSNSCVRTAKLRADAEHSLGMARVLAKGGFPREALPLVAKVIAVGAAAKLAALGELAAGASMATPAQVRDLVDRGSLAPQAETALSALWSAAGRDAVTDIASIIEMGAIVIAGLDESKIAIAA